MNLDRIISVQNSITVFRDGDRCLKVFNEDCAKADVINEALNQARMEQTTVTVPEILEITRVNGKWAIVSEYIKGENLEQLMEKEPEKTEEYMELFAALHDQIHRQSCPMFKKLKDELQRNINDSELPATDRYDLYSKLERIPRYNEVCHGNFVPSKVIISAATGGAIHYRLVSRHAGQCRRRCGIDLSAAANAGQKGTGRAVSHSFLPKKRHRAAAYPPLDPAGGGFSSRWCQCPRQSGAPAVDRRTRKSGRD